ncbi:DUF1329 domain-containing protein [Algiphilus sp.]|uniref:DUF1329 domain-containing protein n=1 Tax=Algiphilus sp. TaxID=1872431 RepID=UPI0032EC5717
MTLSLKRCGAALSALALTLAASPLHAETLSDGVVISAENLDSVLEDTYQGHKISDLLTERVTWLVREHNLKIELGDTPAFDIDDNYWKLTEENAGQATLNTETRQMENWNGAGMPFPLRDIDMDDPHAGDKLIWNFFTYQTDGDVTRFPFTYLLIDGNSGLERTQEWAWIRYKYSGRFSPKNEPNINEEGETILNKTLINARYPRDIRGLGTLATTYYEDRVDDSFAYLPAVRRIRRLSGGAWMDPIGGTDQLQDDINVWNTHPNWYPKIEVTGKRWILVPVGESWSSFPDKDTNAEKYPFINLAEAPYWQPAQFKWEPREVYVIEATAPDEHPYSKKIMYYSTELPWIYQGETYDKKGEFWKYLWWVPRNYTAEDGTKVVTVTSAFVQDYQRMHATLFVSTPAWEFNPNGVERSDASLPALQAGGR